MGALLRFVGIVLAGLAVLLLALLLGARFADGPLGPLPGGPLERGELVTGLEPDWSFVKDVQEIELALVEPPRSRTVWVVVDEGRLYVPCGFLDVPLWKQWPHQALRDGRALVRIDGRRYARQLVRVDEPDRYRRIAELVAEKYGLGRGAPPDPDRVWLFRLDPRDAGGTRGEAGARTVLAER